MSTILLYILIYISFFTFGAYATTDILRLLRGCETPVNAPDCYCPKCKAKIPLTSQIPIISYLKNKGTCQNCHAAIPFSDLLLEIIIGFGFSFIASVLHFSWLSFFLCIFWYEGIKCCYLLHHGVREHAFLRNLCSSLFNNLILFFFSGILFALTHLVT